MRGVPLFDVATPYLLPCNKHQFQHVLLIACLVPANLFMPCLMEVYNSLQAACTKLCMLSHKNLHELRYVSLATALSHFGTRAAVDDAAPDAALNSLPGSLERDALRFRNHAQSTDGLVANQCPCHRGISGPGVAAAVAKAGDLGLIGAGYIEPDRLTSIYNAALQQLSSTAEANGAVGVGLNNFACSQVITS